MKTPAVVLALALLGVLLERCNALAGEDDLLFRSFEQEPQDPKGDSEENANSTHNERISVGKPSYSWKDCGGPQATVRIKRFQMSSTCPKKSGKVTIGCSIAAASDVTSPIKAVMEAKAKVGLIWVNICNRIPGGCEKPNVCPNGGGGGGGWDFLTVFEGLNLGGDEEKAEETAEVERDEGVNDVYLPDNALPEKAAEACVKKGPSSLPAVTRDIGQAPNGQYSVKANFFKDNKPIACLSVLFNVC